LDKYLNTETKQSVRGKRTYFAEEDLATMQKKPASKLNSNFDWRHTNTELAFKDNNLAY
jgi:hypothetical protein